MLSASEVTTSLGDKMSNIESIVNLHQIAQWEIPEACVKIDAELSRKTRET